ncbi:uncharacterized protein LOC121375745 [Gigantopelta aegis]|uniref:uncharacterized protein LOC121375745 n=1 Tax=Gigantopelta aegis TaxID=1735272 RepID=UPI001B889521|nr:uncharacterized protein LOC121375745 [Gigantopelta aegis]
MKHVLEFLRIDRDKASSCEACMGLTELAKHPPKRADKSSKKKHDVSLVHVPEWLQQYERVCQRQQNYLQQIESLRKTLQKRENQLMMVSLERMRHIKKGRFRPIKYPSDSRMPVQQMRIGPEPFPQRVCILHERKGRFVTLPNSLPRNLVPIVRNKRQISVLPPRGTVDRLKTDYEPIETIAERNKINLCAYMKDGCGIRVPKHSASVSSMTTRDSDTETPDDMSLEYITDVSSRKNLHQ